MGRAGHFALPLPNLTFVILHFELYDTVRVDEAKFGNGAHQVYFLCLIESGESMVCQSKEA